MQLGHGADPENHLYQLLLLAPRLAVRMGETPNPVLETASSFLAVPLEVEICASVKNIASFAKRKGGQKIFRKTQLHVIIKPFFSQLYYNFMIKISSN